LLFIAMPLKFVAFLFLVFSCQVQADTLSECILSGYVSSNPATASYSDSGHHIKIISFNFKLKSITDTDAKVSSWCTEPFKKLTDVNGNIKVTLRVPKEYNPKIEKGKQTRYFGCYYEAEYATVIYSLYSPKKKPGFACI